MKGIILTGASAILIASIAGAQTSSTTSALTPAPGAQTSSTTAQGAEAAKKAWGLSLVSEFNTDYAAQNDDGRKATITTLNILGASYNLNDTLTLKAAHQFEMNSVAIEENRAKSDADRTNPNLHPEGYANLDPYIGLSVKMNGIAGSDKFSILNRWYIPMVATNWEGLNKNDRRLGNYRLTAEVPFTLNPKWQVSYSVDPRLGVYEHTTKLDFRHYANVNYNVNDKIQPFFTVGAWHRKGISQTTTGDKVDTQSPTITEDLLSGRERSSLGYAEYGINYSPTSWLALTFGYETNWSIGAGAAKPYSADNSDYDLIVAISM